QHDQVGEDEADNAAERDATAPEHRRQWHIAYRADETEYGNERPNQWALDLGKCGIARQEEALPEALGYPGGQRPRDEEAEKDIGPDGGPVHHEEVAECSEATPTEEPLEERATALYAHVHRGMALHAPKCPALGLFAGLLDQTRRERQPEDQRDDDHHDDT